MCNRCTLSVTENKLLAVFSGGSEMSRVRKFHTWNFRSRERMVLGAKSPVPKVTRDHPFSMISLSRAAFMISENRSY